MSNQLLIIGNGFDLAHGLKTNYSNFTDNYMSQDLIDEWKNFVELSEIKDEWSSFENVIGELTTNIWFNKYLNTYGENYEDADTARQQLESELESINVLFDKINQEFYDFISIEGNKSIHPIKGLSESIDKGAQTISFNYTDTAKLYLNDVHHIHGSLSEENIIFGYPMMPEFNGILDDAARYSKVRKRDTLAFFRKHRTILSNQQILSYSNIFDQYRNQSYTGKGLDFDFSEVTRKLMQENDIFNSFAPAGTIDEKLYNIMKKERLSKIPKEIDNYLEYYANRDDILYLDHFDFSKVKTLIIFGHSINSDQEIYTYLLPELKNLKLIELYTYKGEPQEAIQLKKDTIAKIVPTKIIEKQY